MSLHWECPAGPGEYRRHQLTDLELLCVLTAQSVCAAPKPICRGWAGVAKCQGTALPAPSSPQGRAVILTKLSRLFHTRAPKVSPRQHIRNSCVYKLVWRAVPCLISSRSPQGRGRSSSAHPWQLFQAANPRVVCSALLEVGKVSSQAKSWQGSLPRESSAQPKAQEDPGGTSAGTPAQPGSKRYRHQEQGSKAHLMDGKNTFLGLLTFKSCQTACKHSPKQPFLQSFDFFSSQ